MILQLFLLLEYYLYIIKENEYFTNTVLKK